MMQNNGKKHHVLRKIHDCTFRPKDFLPDLFDPNSPENFPSFHLANILMTFLVIHPKSSYY